MNITLIEYQPQFQADFYRLNEAWIAPHFGMEPEDIAFLQNPERKILAQGGMIFFALEEGEKVLGTCGLLPMSNNTYELVRVAVDSQAQGLGLGKLLVQRAIDWATRQGAKQVILESSTKPVNARAVSLYEKSVSNIICRYQSIVPHSSGRMSLCVFLCLQGL